MSSIVPSDDPGNPYKIRSLYQHVIGHRLTEGNFKRLGLHFDQREQFNELDEFRKAYDPHRTKEELLDHYKAFLYAKGRLTHRIAYESDDSIQPGKEKKCCDVMRRGGRKWM